MKGQNGLKRWLKERIGFADISESTRLGNLHVKALDSSVEHLNHNKKNEVMKLVLQNKVLKTILYHEINSKKSRNFSGNKPNSIRITSYAQQVYPPNFDAFKIRNFFMLNNT